VQFWVYILRCRDGSYYTGRTDDLEKRLWEHREGFAGDRARRRRPVELVWCDWAGVRYDALEFERRVKNWSRAKKEALIAGGWAQVGHFAPPPRERPSASLGTSEDGGLHPPRRVDARPDSFVPSEVEGRAADARDAQ
jgi:predicted GIY-YIG superfamily endonuclease